MFFNFTPKIKLTFQSNYILTIFSATDALDSIKQITTWENNTGNSN